MGDPNASDRTPTRLTVGVVGSDGDDLAEGLEQQSPDLTVRRLEDVPADTGVLSFDCFIVDGTGEMDHHWTYDRVRERHETVPLVVVSTGTNPALTMKLDSDETAARVAPTEGGVPYALLSSRCKELTDHVLIGDDADDGPAYEVRAWEFYALWALATLTYGVGDTVSTLVAVLAFPGLIEGNPVVSTVLDVLGIPGFVVLKTLTFFVAIGMSVSGASANDRLSYYVPPLLATLVGLALTLWNVSLML